MSYSQINMVSFDTQCLILIGFRILNNASHWLVSGLRCFQCKYHTLKVLKCTKTGIIISQQTDGFPPPNLMTIFEYGVIP